MPSINTLHIRYLNWLHTTKNTISHDNEYFIVSVEFCAAAFPVEIFYRNEFTYTEIYSSNSEVLEMSNAFSDHICISNLEFVLF